MGAWMFKDKLKMHSCHYGHDHETQAERDVCHKQHMDEMQRELDNGEYDWERMSRRPTEEHGSSRRYLCYLGHQHHSFADRDNCNELARKRLTNFANTFGTETTRGMREVQNIRFSSEVDEVDTKNKGKKAPETYACFFGHVHHNASDREACHEHVQRKLANCTNAINMERLMAMHADEYVKFVKENGLDIRDFQNSFARMERTWNDNREGKLMLKD